MSTKCPKCGGHGFFVTVRQTAVVSFDEGGDHEVIDGPYGDMEFDEDSYAICRSRSCDWGGTLREAEAGGTS